MSLALTFPLRRLKYVATLNDEALPESTDPDYELQYIDIGNVDSLGKIHEVASYKFDKAPSRARRQVKDGDVIVSTVRTYLQAIAPIHNPPENLIVSTGFAVARPKPELLDRRFFCYALREPRFLAEVVARSTGISYPAINSSELGDIPVQLPPIQTQRRIGTYLERETERIDTLIAEKDRMLVLLAAQRSANVSKCVTFGLKPHASLKASGHAWLGKIPAHWAVKRSKRLLIERDDRSATGEEEMLTVSHLTGITPRSEKDVNMFEAETNEGYKLVSPDNLVINTLWAWMGAMGVSKHKGIVSPAYHVYRIADELLPAYVDALVRTPAFVAEITRFSKGVWSSRLRLYPEGLHEVWIPVPPLDEQRAIVKHLEAEREGTAEIEKTLRDSISLLQERRRALITAAVTGQIPVEAMSS